MMSDQVQLDDDLLVIRQILNGDDDRFDVLVDKYKNRIYGFMLNKGFEFSAAEELTQDVFIQVYRKLHSFKANAMFRTWLYGIARNISLNYINRVLKRRSKAITVETLEAIAVTSESPDLLLSNAQSYETLLSAISNLQPDLREVLELVVFDELSYSEVADIVQIPEGTVKSKLYRARKNLRCVNFTIDNVTKIETNKELIEEPVEGAL